MSKKKLLKKRVQHNLFHKKPPIGLIAFVIAFMGFGVYQLSQGLSSTARTDCTIYVSPSGNDSNNGSSLSKAYKTPDVAASRSNAGDIVCFASGNYTNGIKIEGKNGTQSSPILFTALQPDNQPVFSLGSLTEGGTRGAVLIKDSSHIKFTHYKGTNSMRGTYINSSNYVLIEDCVISSVGQEGIHAGIGRDEANGPSSFITIRGCDISDTGKRGGTRSNGMPYSMLGEMIYIGSGGSSIPDRTHDVVIENNYIHDNNLATAEALDIKGNTYNITIRDNYIKNVDTWCEGAVRIQSSVSGTIKIQRNVIHDVTASGGNGRAGYTCSDANGIRFWAGSGLIEDNIVFRASKSGLYIQGNADKDVIVRNNTLFDNGTDILFNNGATATFSNNISKDGSTGTRQVSESQLKGPLNGSANAGRGPGSGYEPNNLSLGGARIDNIYPATQQQEEAPAPVPVEPDPVVEQPEETPTAPVDDPVSLEPVLPETEPVEPEPVSDVTTRLLVRAYGTTGQEIIELRLNGNKIRSYELSTKSQAFIYDYPGEAVLGDMQVAFVNDGRYNGRDMNVTVDYVRVNGVRADTEASTTYSTGTYTRGVGCKPGDFKRSEKLSCNGYFHYDYENSEVQISEVQIAVRARGTTGSEKLELRINGSRKKTFTLLTSNKTFYYMHDDASVQPGDIRLAFVNDGRTNNVDRNVTVDYMKIGSNTYQTEAKTTYSTGTWRSSDGCNPGFKSSEKLQCNGYVEYRQ